MNGEERQQFIAQRVAKTREAVEEVRVLYGIGHYSTAASRLYYAAFYSSSALLAQRKLEIKTHTGVRNQLNRTFVKTGILSRAQGKLFSKLFDLRQQGDYGDLLEVSQENLDAVLEPAYDLIERLMELLDQGE